MQIASDYQWVIETTGDVLEIACTEPYDDDPETFNTELTIEQLEEALEHMRQARSHPREN